MMLTTREEIQQQTGECVWLRYSVRSETASPALMFRVVDCQDFEIVTKNKAGSAGWSGRERVRLLARLALVERRSRWFGVVVDTSLEIASSSLLLHLSSTGTFVHHLFKVSSRTQPLPIIADRPIDRPKSARSSLRSSTPEGIISSSTICK
ncbi:hypothetical protein PHSY_006560 [Pseudozyma hubeiensis SY62]|uniref:Uncharacterized protein n=1 Tax=Pseudozyma hubeiensis (strain SY62) TaxID=1305764 RepID=R9PC24_PSEHS|nr:hypothetical protein PHSY_006560 [Pseudozyma hubeiensis SY62]GAC98963.1 hypothetical protein PHSY_006560 [Pseudozyma hubeiensis SY62]